MVNGFVMLRCLVCEFFVVYVVGFDWFWVEVVDFVFFVIFEVVFEEFDMGVVFEGQDMCVKLVKEEVVVWDDDGVVCEIFDCGF